MSKPAFVIQSEGHRQTDCPFVLLQKSVEVGCCKISTGLAIQLQNTVAWRSDVSGVEEESCEEMKQTWL